MDLNSSGEADLILPMLIGVCGGSGSGKTVLSRELATALGAERAGCLSLDSYYRPESEIPPELVGNYDHPGVLDVETLKAHLLMLGAGQSIEVPDYNFSSRAREGRCTSFDPCPVIVLEGVLLFAFEEILDELAFSVFLDVPADIRLARRLKRDVCERGRTMESVLHQYFSSVRPMHEEHVEPGRVLADLVIGHEKTVVEGVQEVLKAFESRSAATNKPLLSC